MVTSTRWPNINMPLSLHLRVNECQVQEFNYSSSNIQPLLHIWWRHSKCWCNKWCCIFNSDIFTLCQKNLYGVSDRRFSYLSWPKNHIYNFSTECVFLRSKWLKEYLERYNYTVGIGNTCLAHPWNKSLDRQRLQHSNGDESFDKHWFVLVHDLRDVQRSFGVPKADVPIGVGCNVFFHFDSCAQNIQNDWDAGLET